MFQALPKNRQLLITIILILMVLSSVTACSVNQVKHSSGVSIRNDQYPRIEVPLNTGVKPYEIKEIEASNHSTSDYP